MKNRQLGYVIVGVGVIIGYMFYFFYNAISELVFTSCVNGERCDSLLPGINPNLAYFLIFLFMLYGFYLILFGDDGFFKIQKNDDNKNSNENVPNKDYESIILNLGDDEALFITKLLEEDGSIYQSELVKWSGFNKVRVTRILDKLEGKGLIERKRRGMTNIVILKH